MTCECHNLDHDGQSTEFKLDPCNLYAIKLYMQYAVLFLYR